MGWRIQNQITGEWLTWNGAIADYYNQSGYWEKKSAAEQKARMKGDEWKAMSLKELKEIEEKRLRGAVPDFL